VFITLAPRQLL